MQSFKLIMPLLLAAGLTAPAWPARPEGSKPENGKCEVKVPPPPEGIAIEVSCPEEFQEEELLLAQAGVPKLDKDEEILISKKPDPEWREKYEQKISRFRMWKIINEVDLNDSQLEKFFPLMHSMEKREHELGVERHKITSSMREELGRDKPDEAKVKQMVVQYLDNNRQIQDNRREGTDNILKLLTVNQQARFLLAMPRAERDVWEAIARVNGGPHIPAEPGFDRERLQQELRANQEKVEALMRDLRAKGIPMDTTGFFNRSKRDAAPAPGKNPQ
jgi:hypothetical protein